MSPLHCAILLLSLLPHLPAAQDQPAHSRFEYKYSFKRPHVTLPDGTLPFWDKYGDAIASPDEVRLVPSLKLHSGSMWTVHNASFPHWEVEVSFRIAGHGRQGAEGLALWYTKEPGRLGPVYGSADFWDGVGIIFDTHDKDYKDNNPAILIVGNNGELSYDHASLTDMDFTFFSKLLMTGRGCFDWLAHQTPGSDGSSQALGSCMYDFRNTIRPFRAKIRYYRRTLRVSVFKGLSPSNDVFELCAEVQNMVIPPSGYFGISAATGIIADDHDVLSFLTYSLSRTWQESPVSQIPDSEREKFEKEFEEFQKELDKNIQDFQKEHPKEDDDAFESEGQRELDMVLGGQNRVLEEIRVLKGRMSMTLEEQKRFRGNLSGLAANETTTVKKEQVEDKLKDAVNGIRELLVKVQELKGSIVKVAEKAKDFHPSPSTNFTEDFSMIKKNLQSLVKTSGITHNLPCPTSTDHSSCLTSGIFITFLLLQIICSVFYLLFSSKKDCGTKKVY